MHKEFAVKRIEFLNLKPLEDLSMARVSLEALAMASVDYLSFDMDVEEWEHRELDEPPPSHLLADVDEQQLLLLERKDHNKKQEGEENDQDL